MQNMPLIAMLIFETVSLMTFAIIAMNITRRLLPRDDRFYWAMGGLLGVMAVTGMYFPIQLPSGVVIDARSIMLAAAGAFFGPRAAIAALAVQLPARALMGDPGLWSSSAISVAAVVIGLAWARMLAPRWHHRLGGLALLGVLLAASTFAALPLIPAQLRWSFVIYVAVPLSLMNFLGSMIFGMLIKREDKIWRDTERLKIAAKTDHLTQALNRGAFIRAHTKRRSAGPVALLCLDVDHFKRINDVHGHQIGDLALQHVTRIVSADLPPNALLGRIGGEEFAISWSGCSELEAIALAQRICDTVAHSRLEHAGETLQLTVSVGVFHAPRFTSFDSLLAQADRCLYAAKRAGRNTVVHSGALSREARRNIAPGSIVAPQAAQLH